MRVWAVLVVCAATTLFACGSDDASGGGGADAGLGGSAGGTGGQAGAATGGQGGAACIPDGIPCNPDDVCCTGACVNGTCGVGSGGSGGSGGSAGAPPTCSPIAEFSPALSGKACDKSTFSCLAQCYATHVPISDATTTKQCLDACLTADKHAAATSGSTKVDCSTCFAHEVARCSALCKPQQNAARCCAETTCAGDGKCIYQQCFTQLHSLFLCWNSSGDACQGSFPDGDQPLCFEP